MALNGFDQSIVGVLNSYARRSQEFDALVGFVNRNDLLKGGLIMATLWWSWFRGQGEADSRRKAIIAAVVAGFVAIVVGRLTASFLPFRLRPFAEPSLDFVLPYHDTGDHLRLWSSFPSQHTLFFIALGVGMLYVSWMVGAYIIVHTVVLIALPRVYLGFHYPTDIIGGAVIGAGVAWVLNIRAVRELVSAPLLLWHRRHPAAFYAVLFLVTLQLSTMFAGAIDLLKLIVLGPPVT